MQDPKPVVFWILDSIKLELSLPSYPTENANGGHLLASSTKCSYPPHPQFQSSWDLLDEI